MRRTEVLTVSRRPWTVRMAVDREPWTVNRGPWTVDREPHVRDFLSH